MDVDIATEGIHAAQAVVARLTATEPENPRENPVPLGVSGLQLGTVHLASPAPATQHRPQRQAVTDTCTHLMPASRGAAGAIAFPRTGSPGGHRQAHAKAPVHEAIEYLIGERDVQQVKSEHGAKLSPRASASLPLYLGLAQPFAAG